MGLAKYRNLKIWKLKLRQIIPRGLVLLAGILLLCGARDVRRAQTRTDNTMDTLKQQCVSFNKLLAADRTKSLFRLTDMMLDLREHLNADNVNDRTLEAYVDSYRLSGVALLNSRLALEASGYTRGFRDSRWDVTEMGSRIADILEYPEKIFSERVERDGQYYDVCAVARKDAPGILVGFYRQPTGLISGMERDMEKLLSGLRLENEGSYAIARDDAVLATGNTQLQGAEIPDCAVLAQMTQGPQDGRLQLVRSGLRLYLGQHSGCEGYMIYIYYPFFGQFTFTLMTAAVFVVLYAILWLFLFAVRNQTLLENQQALLESNRHLTETVQMLKSLEAVYFTLFYVNLKEDSYRAIYIAPWLKPTIPDSGRYTELKRIFLDTMVVPEDRENVDHRMSPAFIQETLDRENITEVRRSFYTDYRAIRGGQTPWCRVTATVVDFDEAGTPRHMMALIQDIDVEKRKEAAYQDRILREAREAKIANNAKSEFLRRISHDIRTPINAVQGYLRMGAAYPEDFALQADCRDKATAALGTLLELVNNVLDMSKLESGEILLEERPFDLQKTLDEVNALTASQVNRRGVHQQSLQTGPLPERFLIGSPKHLRQVLFNLASNAVKYSHPGGTVRVDTRLISRTAEEAVYEFVCADDGVGMSEEFQRHMFEPFAQEAENARTTYEGTGLGLSIVKRLVDAMGGTITCDSKKDVGTTFRVRVPFRIDQDRKAADTAEKRPEILRGKQILLVEDNELNMEIAEFLLTSHGAGVTRAWNGKEAVALFAQSEPGHFDLILTDIMMPVMNGLEEARTIRALPREDARYIPIAAMSANVFEDDIRRSLEAGMNAHLPKPVNEERLLAAAAELLS